MSFWKKALPRVVACVLMLVSLAVSCAVREKRLQTELIGAIADNDARRIRALVRQGADVKAGDFDWPNALHFAAGCDKPDAALLVLELGADPRAVSETGVTTLMLAASRGHDVLARRLIERGVPVNAEARGGVNALSLAASARPEKSGRYERVVRLLLDHGADTTQLDYSGQTAAARARKKGNAKVADMIEAAGR